MEPQTGAVVTSYIMKTLTGIIVALMAGFLFVSGVAGVGVKDPMAGKILIQLKLVASLLILGIFYYWCKTFLPPLKFSKHRVPLAVLYCLMGFLAVLSLLLSDFSILTLGSITLVVIPAVVLIAAGIGILYEARWAKRLACVIAFLLGISSYNQINVMAQFFCLVFTLYTWWVLIPSALLEQKHSEVQLSN